MASSYWREIWRMINSERTSTGRDSDGHRVINDSKRFKEMSITRHQRITDTIVNEQKKLIMKQSGQELTSLSDVRKSVAELVAPILSYKADGKPILSRARDNIMNMSNMSGVPYQDPMMNNVTTPNLWIDPGEAASIYSQGGIPALVVNKKSHSILLNGVRIKNPRLQPEQLDAVNESAIKTGLANYLTQATVNGLVYSGGLLFPFFKKDSPLSMSLDMNTLLKYDIVGKDCIDRYVALDKWNTVIIPNWNPTARDFLYPEQYYIPFLGADVSGQRCARIVPRPQAGYWGAVMTMGWGAPDLSGWYPAVCSYESVIKAVPTMINQMSILVHSFNVDMTNAMNGATGLDELTDESTLRVRQASMLNPVSMDVIGELKAIQRDFAEVPALVRLVRQDAAAKANIPEELFWSSERGAFASGDQTEGALERQWESVKYIHRDIAFQMKNIAMLEIINALGKDRDIMKALPYTTIEFDNPITANAEARAKIFADLSKGTFDLTASGVPTDVSVTIAAAYGDDRLGIRSDTLKILREKQVENDARAKEKHEKEMELVDAQIDGAKASAKATAEGGGATGGGVKVPGKIPGKEGGYTRLEQHAKEKTRGTSARRESAQRAEGKKL